MMAPKKNDLAIWILMIFDVSSPAGLILSAPMWNYGVPYAPKTGHGGVRVHSWTRVLDDFGFRSFRWCCSSANEKFG